MRTGYVLAFFLLACGAPRANPPVLVGLIPSTDRQGVAVYMDGLKIDTRPVLEVLESIEVETPDGGVVPVEADPYVERPYVGREEQRYSFSHSIGGEVRVRVVFKDWGVTLAPTGSVTQEDAGVFSRTLVY